MHNQSYSLTNINMADRFIEVKSQFEKLCGVTIDVQKKKKGKVYIDISAKDYTNAVIAENVISRLEADNNVEFTQEDLRETVEFEKSQIPEEGIKFDFHEAASERVFMQGLSNQLEALRKSISPPEFKPLPSPTSSQERLWGALQLSDIVFAIGAAGTGKTYTGISHLVASLAEGRIDRIIMVRPAVEAGENLGFLPGSMKDKMDPYLQPIYDSLNENLAGGDVSKGLELREKLEETGLLQIVPLAHMRGRTFKKAGIYVDEAQNMPLEMFYLVMSRLAQGSQLVFGGDDSGHQNDLDEIGKKSGFRLISNKFEHRNGFEVVDMPKEDAVGRHAKLPEILDVFAEIEGNANNLSLGHLSFAEVNDRITKMNQKGDDPITRAIKDLAQEDFRHANRTATPGQRRKMMDALEAEVAGKTAPQSNDNLTPLPDASQQRTSSGPKGP